MSLPQIPPTFSLPRVIVLLASLLAALAAGTNYVFSAYGPQLGARLGISHTQLNLIGLGGNAYQVLLVGVYISAPIWGKIVDHRGPKSLLGIGFVVLFSGYAGIRAIYDAGLPANVQKLSTGSLALLVLCSLMTGIGGNGGLAAAINTTAKTFPDKIRGSTTGLVISGFGLSAFFFSGIAHITFPGDTSSFLLLLALGTSFPMLIGFFLVRPIPLPSSEAYHDPIDVDHAEADAASLAPSIISGYGQENNSRTHLLTHDDTGLEAGLGQAPTTIADGYIQDARTKTGIEMSPPRRSSRSASRHRSSSTRRSFSQSGRLLLDTGPNIFGAQLWKSIDFWIPFISLSLLSGTGIMRNSLALADINNVGSMAQALYVSRNIDSYNDVDAAQWQATQVSTISLMNFSGRVLIGLLSDLVKSRFNLPRSTLLILVAFIVLSSQVAAAYIEDVRILWRASALLGLGYGSMFSLYATLCIEWFGLPHFSENWGYLSLSPLFGGNIFSVAFGRNLDAHAPSTDATYAPSPAIPPGQCLDGLSCYVNTLHLTIGACMVAIGLSLWATWRDKKKQAEAEKEGIYRRVPAVIWEEEEEEES
ncbi:major facilitator superfamily domain-containing protein [Rhodocollybia butyracea]|uniref:Major facilitator superfamily domain-containing protein n=1 Tax=Rhodocollybia butyracea TaxID=206335 RepID=A0A9P5U814_9AGAR|nr:major facilitator superfamily domain-containing protein [Rhodocollybia butyracea]